MPGIRSHVKQYLRGSSVSSFAFSREPPRPKVEGSDVTNCAQDGSGTEGKKGWRQRGEVAR